MNAKSNAPDVMATVKASWGDTAPGWLMQLARFCAEKSQKAAAAKIGYSAAVVNHVLKNRYTGDLKSVQRHTEAAFSSQEIICPVMGPISGTTCLSYQQAPYNPGNHRAVALFVACKRCPHNVTCKGKKP